jgi:hypothetical protein
MLIINIQQNGEQLTLLVYLSSKDSWGGKTRAAH